MQVNKVFYSLQGEGRLVGIPTVFVRLQGCSLLPHCNYCDTKYAQKGSGNSEMSIPTIIAQVRACEPYKDGWVCITGGEPLWQEPDLELLVDVLKREGYLITIETNGSFEPPRWWTKIDSWNADIKGPSSGVCGVSKEDWFHTRPQDQIKFIVGNGEDLDFAKKTIRKHWHDNPEVLVSPLAGILKEGQQFTEYWNQEWLQEVAEFCKEERVRMSLQTQKLIWGDRRDV